MVMCKRWQVLWRQQDATRNSIQSAARAYCSHSECMNKNTNQLQELLFQKGVNWDTYDAGIKRGRIIIKEIYKKDETIRSRWISTHPPIFTQQRLILSDLIPEYGVYDEK